MQILVNISYVRGLNYQMKRKVYKNQEFFF